MGLARFQSKVLVLLALSVALGAAALLAASHFLTQERYRLLLVEQVRQITGRETQIADLKLTLFPRLQLVLHQVALKNPSGFPAGNTVLAEEVAIGVALPPLLRRELEIDSVRAQGVELHLLEDPNGETNYRPLLDQLATGGAKITPSTAHPVSLVRVGSVTVENVRVSFARRQQSRQAWEPQWSVSGLTLHLSSLDFGAADLPSPVEVVVKLGGAQISTAALQQPLRCTSGELHVQENAAAGSFAGTLGPLRGHGTVKVADLRHPVVDFSLVVPELNSTQVSALVAGHQKNGSIATPSSDRLLARGSVQIGRFTTPTLAADKIRADVRLYGNRVEANPFTAELSGGRTQGRLQVDISQRSFPAQVHARVEGVNVAQLLADAGARSREKVTGTFEADARLHLPLGAPDPLASLSGEGRFAVRDGVFNGLEVEGMLAKIAKFMPIEVMTNQTRFHSFGGDFQIRNRRFHSQELLLDAEALEARLQGSLGFDQKLEYTGTSFLKGQGSGSPEANGNPLSSVGRLFGKIVRQTMKITRMEVQFVVRGTLEEPRIVLAGMPKPTRGRS